MPSLRRIRLSASHEILRFLPESRAPFSRFNETSSSRIESQSSNTTTQLGSEYLYKVWYKPIGVALPLTTSALSLRPAIWSNSVAFSISCSTPKLLPTPGGPDTIIARMSPLVAALVISVRISKRSAISIIRSSSVLDELVSSSSCTIGRAAASLSLTNS